jgi:hypothetical protein
MQMHAERGALYVRLGSRFGDLEAARVRGAVATFGPLSRLTVDFGRVRYLRESAIAELARTARALAGVEVVLRGLPGPGLPAADDLGALGPESPGGTARAAAERRPTELRRSIGPECVVEQHRNLLCVHYDSCLDDAVAGGWPSWSCVRCALHVVRGPPGNAAGGPRG